MLGLICLLACPTPDKDVDPDTAISESKPDDSATDDSANDDTANDDTANDDTADDTAPDDTAPDDTADDTGTAVVREYDLSASGVSLWSEGAPRQHRGDYGRAGGFTAVNVGDTNGDGHADLALGDFWRDVYFYEEPRGGAFLYEGPVTAKVEPADAARDWSGHCTGQGLEDQEGSNFGFAMAALGDVNGDGYDDLAIASPEDSIDCDYDITGAVSVFLGSSTGLPTLYEDAITIRGTAIDALVDVAGVPDTDSDGFTELLIGNPTDDEIYLIRDVEGADIAGTSAALTLYDIDASGRQFGSVVASAGDTNADGLPELLAGSHGPPADTTGSTTGKVWLFDGTDTGRVPTTDAVATIEGAEPADYFGGAVAGAGDVDGDGYDDLIVGAWNDPTNGPGGGAAYVILGPLSGDVPHTDAVQTLHANEGERFGWSVDSAGDIDADGDDEVVIGAWVSSRVYTMGGAAWVLRNVEPGTFDVADADTIQLYGGQSLIGAGRMVSGAGDLDGDGRDDLIISVNHKLSSDPTVLGAYVVYGGDL